MLPNPWRAARAVYREQLIPYRVAYAAYQEAVGVYRATVDGWLAGNAYRIAELRAELRERGRARLRVYDEGTTAAALRAAVEEVVARTPAVV